MNLRLWLKAAALVVKLGWKYRGPAGRILKGLYNNVEKWAAEWKRAGETIGYGEKAARFYRLARASGLTGDVPRMQEETWQRMNPVKAVRRQGKTR